MKKSLTLASSLLLAGSALAAFRTPPGPKDVPELLVAQDGTKIASRADWEAKRRPELLQTLAREEYGVRPVERPSDLTFTEICPEEECFDGKAIHKRIRGTYSGPGGKGELTFSVWIPKCKRPVAAFIHLAPNPSEEVIDAKLWPGYYLPARDICARGYAIAAFKRENAAVDWDVLKKQPVSTSGVFKVYGPQDFRTRKPNDWGILSAWGWGMSRVLDWMETEPRINAKRVGSVGLSRHGKASLCAGVFDSRFALSVSCCSGCCGAKLNHMACAGSETIKNISIADSWFCADFTKKYVGHDSDALMPFDQHQFLAMMAPRLLYVSSAIEDAWAGPRGEFAALTLASAAWGLYGFPTLEGAGFPDIDQPVICGNLGYHVRRGIHDITPYDWACYMNFTDAHGWNR